MDATSTRYPVETWRSLHADGMGWTAIGRAYGVSSMTVSRWVRRIYGVKPGTAIPVEERVGHCRSCGIVLQNSVDSRYPGAVTGHVCNFCREFFPKRAAAIDREEARDAGGER